MTRRTYSSLAAYLAHWRTLSTAAKRAGGLNTEEKELLEAMASVASALLPDEREALLASESNHDSEHRLQRAAWQLGRVLTAAGWLQR
jgi:hypothetical protein